MNTRKKNIASLIKRTVNNKYNRKCFMNLISVFIPDIILKTKRTDDPKLIKIGHYYDRKTKKMLFVYENELNKYSKMDVHLNNIILNNKVDENNIVLVILYTNKSEKWFLCLLNKYESKLIPNDQSFKDKIQTNILQFDKKYNSYIINKLLSIYRSNKLSNIDKIYQIFNKKDYIKSFIIRYEKIKDDIKNYLTKRSISIDKDTETLLSFNVLLRYFIKSFKFSNNINIDIFRMLKKNIISLLDDSIDTYHNFFNKDIFKIYNNEFSKFNFTIREDTIDTINMAIDPIIFEYIMENFYNKQKKKKSGIFYTPYDIIHSMSEKSLNIYINKLKDNENYKVLKFIKICDPACGCGNFLIVMYNILVNILKSSCGYNITEIINNFYGIDIDNLAITITRIRMVFKYLSFTCKIILDNFNDFITTITHNIICKNSLIDDQLFYEPRIEKFDIVISNPPYVGQKGNKHIFKEIKKIPRWNLFYQRKQDLYYYFIVKGIELLKDKKGILSYIIPSYFLTAENSTNLRQYIKEKSTICLIHKPENNKRLFNKANINNIILYLYKNTNSNKDKIQIINHENNKQNSRYSTKDLPDNEWIIFTYENDTKLSEYGCFKLGDIAKINPGIQTGCDYVTRKHVNQYNLSTNLLGNGIFILSEKETERLKLNNKELSITKPFYKNSDVDKWLSKRKNTKWIIITNQINDINEYPNIKNHLLKYKTILDNRYRNFSLQKADKSGKWWSLYGYRPYTNFDDIKIICPYRCKRNIFAYSERSFYASIDVFFIHITKKNYDEKYILALLNTKTILYWLLKNGKLKGNILELVKKPISNIPIKNISLKLQKPFIELTNNIILNKKKSNFEMVNKLENELDNLVYDLYNISSNEIKEIENYIFRSIK